MKTLEITITESFDGMHRNSECHMESNRVAYNIPSKFFKNLQNAAKIACMEEYTDYLENFTKSILQHAKFDKKCKQVQRGKQLRILD